MLNRIYIVIGLLAILVLAAAFVVPRFVAWGDYRDRMEELASGVLGAEVTILGDIEFSLLPQPRLEFTEVVVGNLEEPAVTVASVEAEFSLMEFLRDQYTLTRLVLGQPFVDIAIDENGLIASGMAFAETDAAANVSLQQTLIVDGRLRVADMRAGQTFTFEDLDGDVRLSAFSGPYQFQGSAAHAGARYSVRFNTSALDSDGNSRLSTFIQTQEPGFSVTAEGLLTPGLAPRFDGTMTYRQAPPVAEAAEDIKGDLLLESRVQANTDRVVLSGYTLLPDENRPGTRLTGAASVQLGARNSFDAVISGGVFALPPRDATEDASAQPYELVRLLEELPAPPLPPIPGRIGVDLAEMDLRGFSLREVRADAQTDGQSWTIGQFIARMPGDTEIRAEGELSAQAGRPGFNGNFSIGVSRLDALALLWRRPEENNPLFNMPAAYRARVILGTDALALTDGAFTLEGQRHRADLRIGFGSERRLDVVGQFSDLDATASNALLALVPDLSGSNFGNTFPEGSFSLAAAAADVAGLAGQGLAAEGDWSIGGLALDRLAAGDLGGVAFDAALNLRGSIAEPVVWGRGNLSVDDAGADGLAMAFDAMDVPDGWRTALAPSLPAAIDFDLGEPRAEGRQTLEFDGIAGAAAVNAVVDLGSGLKNIASAPLEARMFLESSDLADFSRQLGLGEEGIFEGPGEMLAAVNVSGVPDEQLDAQINLSSGAESIGYRGTLASVDGEVRGTGVIDLELADLGGVARIIGGRDVALPQVTGTTQVHFEGQRLMRLTDIDGRSGEAGFSGELSMSRTGPTAQLAGTIALDGANVEGLAVALFGRAGLLRFDEGPVPDGPIVIDEAPWQTRGTIAVTAPGITLAGARWLDDVSFEMVWDSTRLRVAGLEAGLGEGRVSADITVCCAGPLPDKTVSGRASVESVAMADVLPPAVMRSLSGTASGGVRFEGSGPDLRAIADALSGEGSFSVAGLTVEQLDPAAYETVAGLDNVLEMEPDALGGVIRMALDLGPFRTETAEGAFTIAGGVARLANLSFEGEKARLAGGIDVSLDTLGLNGAFTMTPRHFVDETGMVATDTARIVSRLSGTLIAPERTLDLDTMVAAVKVRANEIEVERLEALRLEDEARRRAAAEERNRLIEEQMRQRAAEEAARRAAEEEAERQQQQQQPQTQTPPREPGQGVPTSPTGPLVLQPGFQQDINNPRVPPPLLRLPVNELLN